MEYMDGIDGSSSHGDGFPPGNDDEQYDSDMLQELLHRYESGMLSDAELGQILDYTSDMPEASGLSFMELAQQCAVPAVAQVAELIVPLVILCLTYRIIVYLLHQNEHGTRFNHGDSPSITNIMHDANVSDNLLEICDCALGMIVMNSIFGPETLILICYAMTAFVVIVLVKEQGYSAGFLTSLFTVAYVVSCEFYILPSKEWHKIRGAHMVMSMKVISFAFDLENGVIAFAPNFWSYCSYMFHVGTLVFGPWISYKDHHSRIATPVSLCDMAFVRQVLQTICLLITFLLLSTCVIPWIIEDNNNKWLVAYRDAQSFRFSHYFVSYTSQLTLMLASYSSVENEVKVTHPLKIEIPRSLVEVVTNWNIPMHSWLKTYVFKNARHLGAFPAILITYGASSLLHGLNFQLSAVLLTLAFYTYIEHVFRDKLSIIYDACVRSRRCKSDCTHKYKHRNPYVFLLNVMFSGLTVFHLAYLGLMFDSSSTSEKGYNMWHTLSKWENLGYLSHIIAGVTFGLHVLI